MSSKDLYFGIVSVIYMILLLVGLFLSSKVMKLWLAIAGLIWIILWVMVVFPAFLSSSLSFVFSVQILFGLMVFVWNCIGAFERQIMWIRGRSEVSN